MIVGITHLDEQACNLTHQYVGDACVVVPLSMRDLVLRLEAFQRRA
jgi:hypothetical protein